MTKKRLLICLGVSPLILLSLCVLLLVVIISQPSYRTWLTHTALTKINSPELAINLSGFQWPTLGELTLNELRITKNEQNWILIKELALIWNPSALLQKRLELSSLSASELHFHQLENNVVEDKPEPSPFAIPTWVVKAGNIAIAKVQVELKQAQPSIPTFSVTADATLFEPSNPVLINLNAQSLAESDTYLKVNTQVLANGDVRLEGRMHEAPNGVVGQMLRLPNKQIFDARFDLLLQTQIDPWQINVVQFSAPFLDHAVEANGTLTIALPNKQLDLPEFYVRIDGHSQRLRGGINPNQIWFDFDLKHVPLDLAQPWLSEPLTGEVSAKGEGSWLFAKYRLPQMTFKSTAKAQLRQQDITANLAGKLSGDTVVFSDGELTLGTTHAAFTGVLAPFDDGNQLAIKIKNFTHSILIPWIPKFPKDLLISAKNSELNFSNSFHDPKIHIQTDGQVNYQSVDLNLKAKGSFTKHNANIKHLAISNLEHSIQVAGALDWSKRTAKLSFNVNELTTTLVQSLTADINIPWPKGLFGSATGSGSIEGAWKNPQIQSDLVLTGEYELDSTQVPFELTLNGDGKFLSLRDYYANIQRAELTLNHQTVLAINGRAGKADSNLAVHMYHLPTRLLAALGVNHIDGDAKGTLRFKGSPQKPIINGRLSFHHFKDDIDIKTEFATVDEQLNTHFTIAQKQTVIGDLSLNIPLYKYLSYSPDQYNDIPLSANGKGQIRLSVVQSFLNPEVHQLSGKVDTEFTVAGSLHAPSIKGYFRGEKIRYDNHLTNTRFNPISFNIIGTQDELTLTELNAKDQSGGTLEAKGSIRLAPAMRASEQMIQLSLNAKSVTLASTEVLNGKINGALELHGHLQELWLKGKGVLSPLNVSIEQAFRTSIPTIRYTEANEKAAVSSGMPKIHIHLVLSADQQAFVRGRGIETEIGGQLTLTGTPNNLSYRGQFDTKRGRIDAFGKRFILQNGTVQISNDVINMRVQAMYETTEFQYFVELYGNQDAPKVRLSSIPSMPEDEILAR